jgi:hypothetical protein
VKTFISGRMVSPSALAVRPPKFGRPIPVDSRLICEVCLSALDVGQLGEPYFQQLKSDSLIEVAHGMPPPFIGILEAQTLMQYRD